MVGERRAEKNMAVIPKKYFIISANGSNFSIKLPTYYDDISTYIGLTEATDILLRTAYPTKISELKRAAAILEFTVTCRITQGGSGLLRTRRTNLICDLDTAVGAMSSVEGKLFGTGLVGGKVEIINAYFRAYDRFR